MRAVAGRWHTPALTDPVNFFAHLVDPQGNRCGVWRPKVADAAR